MKLNAIWKSSGTAVYPRQEKEFETRATLLQLLREAKTFIQVKVDFYQKYGQKKKTLDQSQKVNIWSFLFICVITIKVNNKINKA